MFEFADQQQFLDSRSKRASSANVIIENPNGELLVVKANYKKYWSLPGGWIDDGETPRQAALREVAEEIGVTLHQDDLELAAVINRVSQYTQTYLFIFKLVNNTTNYELSELLLQASEIDAVNYVSKEYVRQNAHNYNAAVTNWAATSSLRYVEIVI